MSVNHRIFTRNKPHRWGMESSRHVLGASGSDGGRWAATAVWQYRHTGPENEGLLTQFTTMRRVPVCGREP